MVTIAILVIVVQVGMMDLPQVHRGGEDLVEHSRVPNIRKKRGVIIHVVVIKLQEIFEKKNSKFTLKQTNNLT